MELEGLILCVRSFLEELRHHTDTWCRLVRQAHKRSQAWALRKRLLAACDIYLLQSREQRRRLQVGMSSIHDLSLQGTSLACDTAQAAP